MLLSGLKGQGSCLRSCPHKWRQHTQVGTKRRERFGFVSRMFSFFQTLNMHALGMLAVNKIGNALSARNGLC